MKKLSASLLLAPLLLTAGLAVSLTATTTAASATQGPSEAQALRRFAKAFSKKRLAKNADLDLALAGLADFDSEKLAKALVKGFGYLHAALTAADLERLAVNEEIRTILGEQAQSGNRTLPQAKFDRFNQLQALTKNLRARVDGLRSVRGKLLDRIGGLRDAAAAKYLVSKVVGDRKQAMLLKLAAAATAGSLGDALEKELGKQLKRAKRVDDVLAWLAGIVRLGDRAKSFHPWIIGLLAHKDRGIVEQAARACASLHVGQAVPKLVDLMEKTQGTLRRKVSLALEDMTGQTLGASPASWRGWFEREGKDWVAKGAPKRGVGVFAGQKRKRPEGRYYMGIPQDGGAILYVIDSSGSMKQPVKWRKLGSGGQRTVARKRGEEGKKHEMTRLEACKLELIDALSRLEKTKRFNVIWYSDIPHAWSKKLELAQASKVRDAQAWVRKLEPNSSTNIHDALQLGFTFVKGRGVKDKSYSVEGVDTIFLLTDGSPTKPDGSLDDPQKVLTAVKQWNPLKRVAVHTIGIGDGLNTNFLLALAKQNNGVFRHYTDQGKLKR